MKKVMIIFACAVLLFSITACKNDESSIPTYNVSPTDATSEHLIASQPDETPNDEVVPTQDPTISPTDSSNEDHSQLDPTVPEQNTAPSEPMESEKNDTTNPITTTATTEPTQNTATPPDSGTEDAAANEAQPTTQAEQELKEPSHSIDKVVPPTLTPHNPVPEDNYALWWQCEHCGKWIEVRDGHSCYEEHEVS